MQVSQQRFERGQVVPDFTLPRCGGGEPLQLRSLKPRRNVVLLFVHSADCARCRALLDLFAAQAQGLRQHNAEAVVIMRAATETFPWPTLTAVCDAEETATRAYLRAAGEESASGVGLFITDRWQALREWHVAGDESRLPGVETVLARLAAIEAECPECAPVATGWGEEV